MNEIITFGKGYSMNRGIEVFVKSAKTSLPFAKITTINLINESPVVSFLEENNINIIDAIQIAETHRVDLSLSPYTLKVIFFYLYCKNYCTADNVYLTDFTDVYFQGDIFEDMLTQRVTVFSEENTIGNCQTNSTWINICYNRDILGLLKDKAIINGGCILGPRVLVVELLKEMCLECEQVIGRIGNYQNIDQAILNKVVHFDYHRYNIEHEHVANLAQKKNRDNHVKIEKGVFGFDRGFKSRSTDIPKIIHQYDVNKQLEKEIYERYC